LRQGPVPLRRTYAEHVAPGWWRRETALPIRPLVVDVVLALAAMYAAFLLTSEVLATLAGRGSAVAAYAVALLHGASVGFRRLAPLPALAVLLGTAAVFGFILRLPIYMLGPAVLFVAYALGGEFPRRQALVLLASAELALVLLLGLGPGFPGWDSVALYAALVAGSWFLGTLARRWQTLARELGERAAELEQARSELARHAVAVERLRIARELHDVLAHSMSVIAMHAGAARLAVGSNPASQLAALDVIERSSREALGEMRRLVTVLREDEGAATDRGPAPHVSELHGLVAGVVAAGVTVDVHTEGDLSHLPAGVSLAGYRVVQEALTNVVRHAGATQARLDVRVAPQVLAIRVEDEGPAEAGRPPLPGGGGHGSVGMRERVELYGGTLVAGPRPGGGWCVEARLPYAGVER
jgi:signal transduction histidine kinase